jgi:subtilisin family serine protease
MNTTGGASILRAALALGALMALVPAGTAGAAEQIGTAEDQRYAPGEVLVRYEPGTSSRERSAVRREADTKLETRLGVPRVELLSLQPGDTVPGTLSELRSEAEVAFAEPNYVYELAALPNDASFGLQWGFNNEGDLGATLDADIDAPEAWDLAMGAGPDLIPGSEDVTVGVVDSGMVLTHPDLSSNIWSNPDEDGGIADADDGDANTLIDDLHGWDFVDTGDDDPTDEEGHGTHVAGTIGAQGDNAIGVAGVNWDVALMALRACDSVGSCKNADVAEAFAYAGEAGAQVVNASLSGAGASSTQAAAITASPSTLFVFAAGNDANNNDVVPRYPCNQPGQNVICVGSTTDRDGLSSFSNYGKNSVDIAAPGGGSPGSAVYSTHMLDVMSETFTGSLAPEWLTGGTPDTWARTTEPSVLPGTTLTDSPGGDYAPDTDNFARYGPVDLTAHSGCRLRYDLGLDAPDNNDFLQIEVSTDDVAYTAVQGWTGVGDATETSSLNAYSGAPAVYLRFRMLSDSDATVGDGAHLDNIRVRCPSEAYRLLQGTSMASPHVAGAAALLLDQNPGATVADLRGWLLDGADLKPALDGLTATGGRLNLERSVQGALGADIHRPETTIATGPPASSTANTATFSFTSNEPGTFSCSLNGQAFAACTSPHQLSGLAIGVHSFRVRATDLDGNIDATPATASFSVEAATGPNQCAALRKKLKRAKSTKQKRKLRKKIKKRCLRLGL